MTSLLKEFEMLRQIAELSPDMMGLYDRHAGAMVYVNTPGMKMIGIGEMPAPLDLNSIAGKIFSDDLAYVRRCFSKVLTQECLLEFEFRIIEPSFQYVCCTLCSVMEGKFMLISMRDITKAKQGEEHIVEFGSKKNTLLDSLAHNLSGALGMMQNLTTEAIKPSQSENPKRVSRYLELLHENSRFCIEIINDLLINEHEQSAKVLAKSVRFNVMEKIRYVTEELANSYPSKKFVVEENCASCFATSDDVKTLQVLINLISNSIKFTPDGAEIRIIVDDFEDGMLRIAVADTGIGIPPALQPFVFDRKGTAGRPGLNGEKSIGLGLSINKQIVALMGGKLWMESVENVGSTFYFTIPR